MKKYVFIFHVDGPMDMSNGEGEAIHAWFAKLGDKLLDGGNPFNPKSEAHVSGGTVTNEPDTASGYAIVSAEDLTEAVELAKGSPLATLPGCAVKVYETMPM